MGQASEVLFAFEPFFGDRQELGSAISVEEGESKRVKCIAMLLVVSFACLSHTFAVLRPLFPMKPEPPFAKSGR
jgi:hypothetical protein